MRLPNGDKNYELTNHLGNVLAVVSDQKINNEADIIATYDYYPFGAHLVGRTFESESYRYGFGGHEKDDEVSGNGNHLAFGDYGYDTRLGRRWQLDPIDQVYISNYTAFGNDPVNYIDPDGRVRLKLAVNFSMNTGFIGFAGKIFGFGAEVVYSPGGAKQEVSAYLVVDTKKGNVGVGVSHTTTNYESSTDVTAGHINGSVSKEKSDTYDANTIDGYTVTKEKTFREKESGGIVVKNIETNTDTEKVEAKTGVSVNALMVGVGADAALTIEPEPEPKPEPKEPQKKK